MVRPGPGAIIFTPSWVPVSYTHLEQADIQAQIESYHAMRYARDHSPEARQARAAVTFAAGVSLGAFLAPVFYIFACLLVMSSLLDTWPTLLEELFFQYASGRADAATVLHLSLIHI